MEIRLILNMEGKIAEACGGTTADPATIGRAVINAIGCLPEGMSSGKTSIGMVVIDDQNRPHYCETSLKAFQIACAYFTEKFGDESGGETQRGCRHRLGSDPWQRLYVHQN